MRRQAELSALLIATAWLSAETCRAQFSLGEGSYAHLLAQYDRNGNGLLDDRERAALLAPADDQQPLSLPALPLICDVQSAGNANGASASAKRQISSPSQVARHGRSPRRQFAEDRPQADRQPNQADQAEVDLLAEELDDGYAPGAPPQPPESPQQSVRFRNAVQYRMLLNESKAPPRSQPFARAATFGPIIGRSKQQPQRYFAANTDVGCSSTRFTVYRLARY